MRYPDFAHGNASFRAIGTFLPRLVPLGAFRWRSGIVNKRDVKPEIQWRVNLDGQLHERFVEELDRLGLSQKAGTSRLITTFLAQDADVRAMMLQLLTPERSAML